MRAVGGVGGGAVAVSDLVFAGGSFLLDDDPVGVPERRADAGAGASPRCGGRPWFARRDRGGLWRDRHCRAPDQPLVRVRAARASAVVARAAGFLAAPRAGSTARAW